MLSRLVLCPSIGRHHIQKSDQCRTLIVDDAMVKFTPTEYRLLVPLLCGHAMTDRDLAQAGFACDVNPQIHKSIEKHIDKIRGKLRLFELNIHRVAKYGYILLETETQA